MTVDEPERETTTDIETVVGSSRGGRDSGRPCVVPADREASPPVLNPTHVPTERLEFLSALRDSVPEAADRLAAAESREADFNSVALFFNLQSSQPPTYSHTTPADVEEWLDEGADPASPTISEFMIRYWDTLSYGNLAFGVDTPRDEDGTPLVPTVSGSGGWHQLINRCLDANPEAIWEAAGGLTKDGKRWIPSVALVQNYDIQAHAKPGGYDRTIDGTTYRIGTLTHIPYELERHATEEVGYVALDATGEGGADHLEEGVTDGWSTIDFDASYAEPPVVVASVQTFDGSDPVGIRMRRRSGSSVDVKLEEERSLNPETAHVEETVGYLALEPGAVTDAAGARVGEAGTLDLRQPDDGSWHTVDLDASYDDPVVLLQLLTYNGHEPCHTRLRSVRDDAFEFQLEEWDYLNQRHVTETVGYVVVEPGRHELDDGSVLDVGRVKTDHGWTTASLGFDDDRDVVVLSHAQTRNGKQAMVTRHRDVSGSGFDVRVQEEERNHRRFWGSPLAHEYAHNFLEFGDLYGPQGATLYWDLLGDAALPADMSEVSSVHKARVDWLEFTETVEGSTESGYTDDFSLDPYTTSGECLKVVPDPEHNPYEYFVIEYRGATGSEPWRPDGGLEEAGLLITHFNERMLAQEAGSDGPGNLSWFNSVAPYFDPEFADYRDEGDAMRGGEKDGVLFTGGSNRDRFAPDTKPSSEFYGGRSSTLTVSDIDVTDERASFRLSLDPVRHRRLWHTSDADRGIAGRFTSSDPDAREEILFRNDDEAALLTHSETKWFVRSHQAGRIDGWNLGAGDRELAADLDGDGADEVYIRSDNWAGVLRWAGEHFEAVSITQGRIDGWNLGAGDRELAADLDGDGADEVYVRSDDWAGVLEWDDGLSLRTITQERVGDWRLGASDAERAGRFTDTTASEVAVVGDDGLGVLRLDPATDSLESVSVQRGGVGGWQLAPDDEVHVGDFDGDGRDELYVRKDDRAGVMRWADGGFDLVWERRGDIKGLQDPSRRLSLDADDRSYAGQFLPSTDRGTHRDGVFHVAGDRISLLSWDDGSDELRVENFDNGGWFTWEGETELVLGDFHRVGPETAKGKEFIADEGTDAFLHNRWGTGTIGVDVYRKERGGANTRAPSVFWRQEGHLLSKYEPTLLTTVRNPQPVDPDGSLELVGALRGVVDADDWPITWAFEDPDGNWHSMGTSDPGVVFEYDGLPDPETGAGTEGSEIVACRATAAWGEETLTTHFTVEFASEGPKLYERHADPATSGSLSDTGQVVSLRSTDYLRVGDDSADVALQTMLTFDLELPEDVSPADISESTLELVLQPPTGTPYADLSDLVVVHADYGDTIEPSDFRDQSLTVLPGRAVVPYGDGSGARSVDVTTAIRNAWENRDARGDRVQFAVYHRRLTDGDSTADHTNIAAEDPETSSHNSLLRVRYETGGE